jgi:hypothetical protein
MPHRKRVRKSRLRVLEQLIELQSCLAGGIGASRSLMSGPPGEALPLRHAWLPAGRRRPLHEPGDRARHDPDREPERGCGPQRAGRGSGARASGPFPGRAVLGNGSPSSSPRRGAVRDVAGTDYDISFGARGGLDITRRRHAGRRAGGGARARLRRRFPGALREGRDLRPRPARPSRLYYANNNAWFGRPTQMLAGNPLVEGTPQARATTSGSRATRITASTGSPPSRRTSMSTAGSARSPPARWGRSSSPTRRAPTRRRGCLCRRRRRADGCRRATGSPTTSRSGGSASRWRTASSSPTRPPTVRSARRSRRTRAGPRTSSGSRRSATTTRSSSSSTSTPTNCRSSTPRRSMWAPTSRCSRSTG